MNRNDTILVTPDHVLDRLDRTLVVRCLHRATDPSEDKAMERLAQLCAEANAFVFDHAGVQNERRAPGTAFEVTEVMVTTFRRIACDAAHGMLAVRHPAHIAADGHKMLDDAWGELCELVS